MAAVGFYEKRASIERIHCWEDSWLSGAESALLAVPSVPPPESVNYLFNSLHPGAQGVEIEWCKRIKYDSELFHMPEEPSQIDGCERSIVREWYLCVRNGTQGVAMETLKIGIREFRDKLATYLLESETPLAITRHGDTVGYFIPARRKRSESERMALKEASARWQEVLDSKGISEEEAVTEFKRLRAKPKR